MVALKIKIKFFEKTLILSFEANSALSHENETKIVKITHSAKQVGSEIFIYQNIRVLVKIIYSLFTL